MFLARNDRKAAYSPPQRRSRFAQKAVAFSAAGATAGALTIAVAPAHAADGFKSGEATGAFVDLGPILTLINPDYLVELEGVDQVFPPDAGSADAAVPTELLSILGLEISRLLSLDIGDPDNLPIELGAVAQYALASASSVTAASGAVTNTGVIELNGANGAPPANATFDL